MARCRGALFLPLAAPAQQPGAADAQPSLQPFFHTSRPPPILDEPAEPAAPSTLQPFFRSSRLPPILDENGSPASPGRGFPARKD